ncbi:MAG: neutral zinc metallopeptidase [Sphingomonadaceae bacterium]
MRLGDYRTSKNVSRQRGGLGGRGMGRGGLGLVLSLVASRFGIVGVIVVLVGAMLLGFNPFGGGGQQAMQAPRGAETGAAACDDDAESLLVCRVLASTEDTWSELFSAAGTQYRPAGLNFYDRAGRSGCGVAQSAMGPFYCPLDNHIYLDTSFFDELENRFGASGDFAQGYVIAHEVGHHIQNLTGTLGEARAMQQRLSGPQGNEVQVRVELQADCLAGVWAANATTADGRPVLEPGDIEEGMRAAAAIGDDTLQKRSQGYVVPESFTHGTSAQRQRWLERGLESGDPAACDTGI